jgi:ATP-dependent DNA ligase
MNIWNNRTWHPMLLEESEKPFHNQNYIFEIKFDGYRAILFATQKGISIKSRKGRDLTHLFPELQMIKKWIKYDTILDGEIVLFDKGRPSFSKLQTRAKQKEPNKIKYLSKKEPVAFVRFDILYQNKELINNPLWQRKEVLNQIPDSEYFIKVKYIKKEGIQIFQEIKKLQLEGMVAKKIDSLYKINTRSKEWIKIKNIKKEYFWICGYIDNQLSSSITLILGEKKQGKYYFSGKVLLGKKRELAKLIQNLSKQNKNNLENITEDYITIPIIYQCEVSYTERTKNNFLRHAKFESYRKE